ncbi:MAG: glycosyltransferase family 2 protein [Ignavibacterium sp.]|nr:glycosyltransferase family 2 protein [Ignavibacterium sp.]
MPSPLVSVVIPLFNKERDVLRAVSSVLSQTIPDFEIIIVNDGSTDKGPEIVKSINDHRIRVIDQPNAGVSAARNRGIDEAESDCIAFIDADDEWMNDFLETIMRLREKFPICDVFATNYSYRRKNKYNRQTIIRGLPNGFREGVVIDYFKIAAQSDPPIWSSAVAVTKKALQAIGGFPINVTSGEDLLTWARLAVNYQIAYTIQPKAYFHQAEILADPPRRPQSPDVVGEQLKVLLTGGHKSKIDGLSEYIALWHRMRANIFIRLNRSNEARKEIFKAISYSKLSLKLCLLTFLTILPFNVAKKFIKLFKIFGAFKIKQSQQCI